MRDNSEGLTTGRWFHAYGCRRWRTVSHQQSHNRKGMMNRNHAY
ncbi:MAG: hypothetical protein ACREEM_51385, partial [Blastocatellia bacterium]